MGEQFPILDPAREGQLAKSNAAKLFGDDIQKAQADLANALNDGNEREQKILLEMAKTLEWIGDSITDQADEQQNALKTLSHDLSSQLQRIFTSTSTTPEDIEAISNRLAEVLNAPARAGGGTEREVQFDVLQQVAEDFARSITEKANADELNTERFERVVENVAEELDEGRAAPMVGETKFTPEEAAVPDVTEEVTEAVESVGDKVETLASSIGEPLEDIKRSLGVMVEGVTNKFEEVGTSLTSHMKELAKKEEKKEEKRDEKQVKSLSERLGESVGDAILSPFKESAKYLGMLFGTLVALKDELLQSLSFLGGEIGDLWKKAQSWLRDNWGPIGEYIAEIPAAIKMTIEDLSEILKKITDWFGWTKTEAELAKERQDIQDVGGYKAAQAVIQAGGAGAKLAQEALREGVRPAHAAWFGTMVDTDPAAATAAYETYKAGVAAGEDADEVFAGAKHIFRMEKGRAKVAASTSTAADQVAQGSMMKKDSATATSMNRAAENLNKATEAMAASQARAADKPKSSQTLDTIGPGDATGFANYVSGSASGGTV